MPDLVEQIRAALAHGSDPERAAGQQRYMKSAMPYRGLTSPQLRTTLRPIIGDPDLRLTTRAEWSATIERLWHEAEFREEWYAAIAVARARPYDRWVDSDSMPLWRSMIHSGAWWDVVDDIATHLVRSVLVREPEVERTRLREWAADDDLWVRRAAIIAQVGLRDDVDQALLTDVIEANLADRDFFIRKAIGWALRDHARVEPEWVRAFVGAHPELSGLSRREALKHL